jgi:BMFP domain-containing protein YqiC
LLSIEQDVCQFRIVNAYQGDTKFTRLSLRYRGAGRRQLCTTIVSKHGFSAERAYLSLAFLVQLRYQSHMGDDSIENLARKLAESVPDGVRSIASDLETNFRGVLRSGLSKLDLVTREEFEVQEAVLARTREKLERLETQLEELEKDL